MITTGLEFADALDALRHDGSASWSLSTLTETAPTTHLIETLCAFGNMPDGGTIICGVDAVADVVGIHDPAALERRIANCASERIEPPVQVQFARVTVDDQTVVVANVHGRFAYAEVHRVKATNTTYLRCIDGNRVLSDPEIQYLATAGQPSRHDQVPVDSTTQHHLDSKLIQKFLHTARLSSPRLSQADDTAILRMKGILEPDGDRLTVAGLYALGSYPQQFLPSLSITAWLRSSTVPEAFERYDFDGPLPELLERAVRWVVRNIQSSRVPDAGGDGCYATPVPIHAIREVIANALVHRDLNQSSWGQNIQLVLEDDRLTVTSPGGLWAVSKEQLGHTAAQPTSNELLYGICRFTPVSGGHSVVNAERGGLREVNRMLRSVGLKATQLVNTGLECVIVFGRPARPTEADQEWLSALSQHQTLTQVQKYILITMRRGQQWSGDAVQETFIRRRATAIEHELQDLVARGLVGNSGTGKRSAYRLTNPPSLVDSGPLLPIVELEPIESPEGPETPTESSTAADTKQVTIDDRAQRAAASSKHGGDLWEALLEGAQDVHELARATNLNVSQVRYAMQRLVNDGLVGRSGGQGHRQTTYFVSGP